ncbi:ImmA/IrrE family metallo-endopeptidase [Synechococcus sp. W55.2]|uniref:ImmA/IrrE family metallo-endopeptidase n=1 Tax=Synechococcus sp. W55.2 TaxID=2964513 RepID=UPI0039C434C1
MINVGYIQLLREYKGLSQADLANKVGLPLQAIAACEKGECMPSIGQLAAVARALGVPLEVFFEQNAACPPPPDCDGQAKSKGSIPPAQTEPTLLFRADDPKVLTPALKALVLKRALAYAEIEEEIGEVAVSPPQMPVETYDPHAVERYAGDVRDFLGVEHAPLGDVIARLEERGLKILLTPLPARVSGLSAYTESLGAVIVVNDNHPVERQFFTALHELAHLICHRQDFAHPEKAVDGKLFSIAVRSTREKLANHLARSVLLPRDVLERELQAFRHRWVPEAMLLDLKLRYSVSMRTVLVRAAQIGIISRKQCGQQIGVVNCPTLTASQYRTGF